MKNLSLEYLIKEPVNIKDKNPLILLIHGYGSNMDDLFSFATELPNNAYVVSVQAPLSLGFGAYAWYPINFDADENKFSDPNDGKKAVQFIHTFINELIEHYPIDINKLFLVGFSQGAILSYATAFTYPNTIPYVVALSGYLNKDFISDLPQQISTSFFISHGSVDQVIPVEWARKSPIILNELNISNIYKEYPVGHGVHPTNFYDFHNWILEKI